MERHNILFICEENKLIKTLKNCLIHESLTVKGCKNLKHFEKCLSEKYDLMVFDSKLVFSADIQIQNLIFSLSVHKMFLNANCFDIANTNNIIDPIRNEFLSEGFTQLELLNRIHITLKKIDYYNDKSNYQCYKPFFEQIPDALFITNIQGKLLEVNDSFCKLLQMSKNDLLTLSLSDLDQNFNSALFEKFWMRKGFDQHQCLNSTMKMKSEESIHVDLTVWKKNVSGEHRIFGIAKAVKCDKRESNKFYIDNHKYRKMFEDNKTIMLIINPENGQIEDANDSALCFYGYNFDQLTSMKISDINILNADEVKAEMLKARRGNKEHFVFKHKTADGTLKDVNVFSNRIKINGRDMLYSIIHVATREKAAEKAIVKAKETAELYLDMAGSIFVNIDIRERIIMMNHKGLTLLGYTRDEVIGKNWFDLCIREEERDKIRHVFRKIINKEADYPEHFENVIVAKDGKEITLSWQNTYLKDDNNRIVSVLSSGIDITHRIESERILMEKEELLRTLVENQGEGVAILTEDFVFNYANPSAEKIFGIKQEELYNMEISDIFNPTDINCFLKNVDTMLLSGKATFEIPYHRLGDTLPLLFTITPKTNKEGKLIGIYCVFRDFSEQKEILKRLNNQKVNHIGLIPICASCFKIRNEEKNDEWQSPVDYLSEKIPEMKFTHSICPDCQTKLYPGFKK